jgi:hypothetical protein
MEEEIMSDKVTPLFKGDTRNIALIDQLFEAVRIYGGGLPIPSIIGCLELVKMQVLTETEHHEQ